jgi:hypothetical protein
MNFERSPRKLLPFCARVLEHPIKDRLHRSAIVLSFGAGLTLLAGCVTVPVYDSKTDDMLTSLQRDTDNFIAHLSETYDTSTAAGKACAYQANKTTYQQFAIDIDLLQTRANALYDDQATLAALADLQSTYSKFEAAHKEADNRPDHCIIPALLTLDQRAMDSAIGSVLKLELAKKGVS